MSPNGADVRRWFCRHRTAPMNSAFVALCGNEQVPISLMSFAVNTELRGVFEIFELWQTRAALLDHRQPACSSMSLGTSLHLYVRCEHGLDETATLVAHLGEDLDRNLLLVRQREDRCECRIDCVDNQHSRWLAT